MTIPRATPRLLALALTLAATIWAAAIFFAPHSHLPLLAAGVRGVGSVVCHQRADRTFHVAAVPMPVCARCTGLYVAGALGALAAWLGKARVPSRTRLLFATVAAPTAITFTLEWLGMLQPGNAVRAAAALPLGACAGWLFVRLLRVEEQPSTCAIIS
jgi:uncharacterized membrane protein